MTIRAKTAAGFIGLGVLIGGVRVAIRRHNEDAHRQPPSTNARVEGAVAEWKPALEQEAGATLNYSPASIALAEKTLARLYTTRYRDSTDDKARTKEALHWGLYIGEVMRRENGGWWEEAEARLGIPFPLHLMKPHPNIVFPFNWCYGRLKNGAEDNVYNKYRFMTGEGYWKIEQARKKRTH